MKRILPFLALAVAACGPGVYTRAEVVYAEPAQYVYVVPVERVVVVTRDVLMRRGYAVYRVEEAGPNRIIWARRGDDEVVRVFVNPEGQRVMIRGLNEARDRGKHKGWVRKGRAEDVITDVDVRLRAEAH
ncbi:MAG TPA: hypothetical protein VEM13_07520 [Gemmatimonadales bacterium]|nr:hypothetical protein [Gemmatimonadales bacterium]